MAPEAPKLRVNAANGDITYAISDRINFPRCARSTGASSTGVPHETVIDYVG